MSFDILNDSEVRCGGSRVGQKLFCRRVFPVQVSQLVNLIVERLFFFIVDLTNTDQFDHQAVVQNIAPRVRGRYRDRYSS